jgi:hypothetical protein
MELPTAAQRANSFLAFDANGVPTAVVSGSTGAPTTITRQVFSGTGSQTVFTLASDPGALGNSAQVYIGGVYQQRSTYTIGGTTLTFSSAPVAGTDNIEFVNFLTSNIGATSADLVTYTPSGTSAVARSAASKFGEVVSVKDFGAVGNGVADDTTAIQAAINAVQSAGGGSVYFPSANYKITSSLLITNGNMSLVGQPGAKPTLTNAITGAAADPLLKITTVGNYISIQDLTLSGNSLTGSNGNGNAISVINTTGSGLWPQVVKILDCTIQGHRGTGKDQANASIPACGIFAYMGQLLEVSGTTIYLNAVGSRLVQEQKVCFVNTTVDANDYNGLYLDTTTNVSLHGCVIQSSGSGSATDGLVYCSNVNDLGFFGCRMKNGNPYCINMGFTTTVNKNIRFYGTDIQQVDIASGTTAVRVGMSDGPVLFDNCNFLFVNTMTNAIGILNTQGAGGFSQGSFIVRGCQFGIGSGGTIDACIRINPSSTNCCSPLIEGNSFGFSEAAGVSTTITNAIDIVGTVQNPVIRNNIFQASTNVTLTNAIKIGSGVSNVQIEDNSYITSGGTLTNQLNNTGSIATINVRESGKTRIGSLGSAAGISRVLSATTTWDPPSIADGAQTNTTVTVTNAAIGDTCVVGFTTAVPAGAILVGQVTSANTVTVTLFNKTGSALDLASGTLRATAIQY